MSEKGRFWQQSNQPRDKTRTSYLIITGFRFTLRWIPLGWRPQNDPPGSWRMVCPATRAKIRPNLIAIDKPRGCHIRKGLKIHLISLKISHHPRKLEIFWKLCSKYAIFKCFSRNSSETVCLRSPNLLPHRTFLDNLSEHNTYHN